MLLLRRWFPSPLFWRLGRIGVWAAFETGLSSFLYYLSSNDLHNSFMRRPILSLDPKLSVLA